MAMTGRAVTEQVILRSTMHVRLEFGAEEHRLDFRASYPRGTTLPLDRLLARVASLCGVRMTSSKRLPDWGGVCEELVDVAEAGGDLSCHCEHEVDAGGSQFVLVCHAVD
ncbi:MAG: hypothetical protein ACRDJH_21740 [Thermomicrobiales bacterium]